MKKCIYIIHISDSVTTSNLSQLSFALLVYYFDIEYCYYGHIPLHKLPRKMGSSNVLFQLFLSECLKWLSFQNLNFQIISHTRESIKTTLELPSPPYSVWKWVRFRDRCLCFYQMNKYTFAPINQTSLAVADPGGGAIFRRAPPIHFDQLYTCCCFLSDCFKRKLI